MRRIVQHYGASPLHLLALLASFALAGYAARLLTSSRWLDTAIWFVGAAIGHDLFLLPLYAIADHGLIRTWHARPGHADMAPWINYLRFPAAISALLFLVFLPSILRLSGGYHSITGLSSAGYLDRWLAVTGVLFALSAVAFAIRLRRAARR